MLKQCWGDTYSLATAANYSVCHAADRQTATANTLICIYILCICVLVCMWELRGCGDQVCIEVFKLSLPATICADIIVCMCVFTKIDIRVTGARVIICVVVVAVFVAVFQSVHAYFYLTVARTRAVAHDLHHLRHA